MGKYVCELSNGYSGQEMTCDIPGFFTFFEELPDSQEKPEVQLNESIISEVEKAKEELRKEISDSKFNRKKKFTYNPFNLEEAAQNLLDALEGGKNQEETRKEKPQSIWKPVSELPTDEKLSVIVELESGEKCFSTYTKEKGFTEIDGSKIWSFYGRPYQFGFSPKEIKYCTITDFINDIEQTKLDFEERLRKLEGK